MVKKHLSFLLILIIGFCIGCLSALWCQTMDNDSCTDSHDIESVSVKWRQDHFILNKANLYNELIAQGIDFADIVLAQSILETGHFKSHCCLQRNNLFGLRNRDGTYMSFNHWTESVESYKKYIQKYDEPPNDYYRYLDSLGYAEDPDYINKLKEIVSKNDKRRSE